MTRNTRDLTHGALIAALYAVVNLFQNLLFPGSTGAAIQFRAAEALCVLALLTPSAIGGLTVGCFVYNLTLAGALPLDALVGSAATALAAWGMWRLRRFPVPAMLLPALTNALLVGWELTVCVGGAFRLNALYVAAGEAAVLLTLGNALYFALKRRRLARRLFAPQ